MKIMVSTTVCHFLKNKKRNNGDIVSLPNSCMDCLLGVLATLSILVARVVPLGHRKILAKASLFETFKMY